MIERDVLDATLGRLAATVRGLAVTPVQAELLGSIVERFAATTAAWPVGRLAPLALPHAVARGYGADTDLAESVAAVSAAVYLSFDLMDELVDGDESPLLERSTGPALFGAATTLCALVPEMVVDLPLPDRCRSSAVRLVSRVLREVSAAELDQARRRGQLASVAEAVALAMAKTGSMLAGFAELAALAAGREDRREPIGHFGRHLGAARQLCADASELWADTPARDLAAGLCPLPLAILAERADPGRRTELAELLARPAAHPDELADLQAELRQPAVVGATVLEVELVRAGAGMIIPQLELAPAAADALTTLVHQSTLVPSLQTTGTQP